MAESRRVQLTTLSCNEPSYSDASASALNAPPCVLRGNRAADTDSVRLVLNLFESDEQKFPEFSFAQLIEKKINETKDKVPLSRLEEEEKRENDEVTVIARQLEEKYGGKPKKKKDRVQDLVDIGYGYDDEDSFIDNSEAYDEFVPASITTKFGGFYVNSGVLQFRQASDTETDDEHMTAEEKTLEATKKRKLSGGQDKAEKKQCRAGEEMETNMAPKLSSELGPYGEMKVKKKKKAVKTLSVTSMLKKFQREKERERQKMETANQQAAEIMGAATTPLFPADAAGGGGSGLTDPLLSLIGSTNDHAFIQAASTVDFDIDLDSLLEVSEDTSSPKSCPHLAAETQQIQTKTEDQNQSYMFSEAKAQTPKTNSQLKPHPEQIQFLSETSSAHQCGPLLEGLPPGLEDSIRKLTVAAKTSEGESKLKFFNPDINSILLEIELQCREQGGQLRSKVYTHLSSFLPCSRDTLLKRVKKLLNTHMEEPPGVEDPTQKLVEAIGRSMPEQITCFRENCQAYEQVRSSKASEDDNVEERSGKRGPRKWFKWNEEIRECFGHVLMEKIEKYKKESKGSQEMEEYLKTLLETEIKPLWPKGWMQSRVLIRESRKLLGPFSSLPRVQGKKVKAEKRQSSISGASSLSDGCHSLQRTLPLIGEHTQDQDHVPNYGSNMSTSVPFSVVQKEGAAFKKGEAPVVVELDDSPAESDKPLVSTRSAPGPSLLDLLADQALAQENPLTVSQELLAAAVAKYKRSLQQVSFGVDTGSPPLPPPPPQSSPVGFLVSRVCQVVVPGAGQAGGAGEVHVISDDDDITIQ